MTEQAPGWGTAVAYDLLVKQSVEARREGILDAWCRALRDSITMYRSFGIERTAELYERTLNAELPVVPRWESDFGLWVCKADPDTGEVIGCSLVQASERQNAEVTVEPPQYFDERQVRILMDHVVDMQDVGLFPSLPSDK